MLLSGFCDCGWVVCRECSGGYCLGAINLAYPIQVILNATQSDWGLEALLSCPAAAVMEKRDRHMHHGIDTGTASSGNHFVCGTACTAPDAAAYAGAEGSHVCTGPAPIS